MIELEPLGGVDRHDRHGFGLVVIVAVHNEADMFEEFLERFIFLHRADEFGEIFEPPRRLDAAVGLAHRGIDRFVDDDRSEARRLGDSCVSTLRSRWWTDPYKQHK